MLEVCNLHKVLGEVFVLQGVSFSLQKGEIGVFLGKSGGGKSTLLRMLNCLENWDAGECFLDEVRIDKKTVHKEHKMGMVFQHYHLFENLSVEKNILLALTQKQKKSKKEAQEIASSLLSHYSLFEKKDVPVQCLSGGQKQRLALARTMALNPDVLCLDEPTSALDPTLRGQVAKDIIDLAKQGKMILLTTHDMAFASLLPAKLFLMQSGVIVEQAFYEQVKNAPLRYPLLSGFMQR